MSEKKISERKNTEKKNYGKEFPIKKQVSFLAALTTRILLLSFITMMIWRLDTQEALGVHLSKVYATVNITQDGPLAAMKDQAPLNEGETKIPLPITLTSLGLSKGVHEGQDAAHVEWTMSSEIGTTGFYILRSTTAYYDDAVAISGFIPCLSGIHSEYVNEYEYWDTRIVSSKVTYAYWLQEMKDSGHTIYGPLYMGGEVRTVEDPPAGAGRTNMRIYLPILMGR